MHISAACRAYTSGRTAWNHQACVAATHQAAATAMGKRREGRTDVAGAECVLEREGDRSDCGCAQQRAKDRDSERERPDGNEIGSTEDDRRQRLSRWVRDSEIGCGRDELPAVEPVRVASRCERVQAERRTPRNQSLFERGTHDRAMIGRAQRRGQIYVERTRFRAIVPSWGAPHSSFGS